jgi:DtxR family Mn-dependent transcriptional regulator
MTQGKYSTSRENYLKAIYHLQEAGGMVTTNELATELQTRAASVTDMLKKLKSQKLLQYEKYRGFRLTAEGKKVALQVIRKHRLWEYFLVEKMKFGWDEVHEIAEELEHISSRKLVDRLDEYLGYPKVDPHGDPIPDNQGKIALTRQVSLAQLPMHTSAEVSGIGDQSPEMLDLLSHKNIQLGTRLETKKHFAFDHSLEIKVKNHPPVTISEEVAKNIFVKYGE